MSREPSEHYSDTTSSSEAAPDKKVTESPKSLNQQLLSVNTSTENLGRPHDLSPIAEDERSAVEERRMQFGQVPAPVPVQTATTAGPVATGGDAGRMGLAPAAAVPAPAVTTAAAPVMARGLSAGASSVT